MTNNLEITDYDEIFLFENYPKIFSKMMIYFTVLHKHADIFWIKFRFSVGNSVNRRKIGLITLKFGRGGFKLWLIGVALRANAADLWLSLPRWRSVRVSIEYGVPDPSNNDALSSQTVATDTQWYELEIVFHRKLRMTCPFSILQGRDENELLRR